MIETEENINLKSEEIKSDKVFEDFNCSYSLSEESSVEGKLCYSENFIEFISEREENKAHIDYKNINNIILNNTDNIEIETNEKKFIFFSFQDSKTVFEKIDMVYKLYNGKVKKEEKDSVTKSDSGYSDNDVDDENNKTILSSKYSTNSSISNDASVKEDNNIKTLKVIQSSSNIKKLHLNDEKDEKKEIIRNNSSNDLKISKKLDFLEPKENEENHIIPEKIKFNKIDTNIDALICTKIINLPPKEFFEKYQTNKNKETSYHAYYDYVGEYSEVEVPEWEPLEKKENEIQKYQRKEKFCISLHGVPLINKSHVEKTCEYWVDNNGTYFFHTLSISTGVPLSDKFTVETTSEFHPYMNNTKTVFRTYQRTNIIKWTIFKMALIYQGKKTYTQEIEKWLKFITEKGDKIEGDYEA
jgi:hypothetical protein